jgi:basic membrane lipoprotein Med (substrate-binding protein (PBP1-ABC) superfamily)
MKTNKKYSEMLIDVSLGFITIDGEDIEEIQNNLNVAITAWNTACYKNSIDREKMIKRYMKEIKEFNNIIEKEDLKTIEFNLRKVIEEIDKKYPDETTRIVDGTVKKEKGRKITITVATVKE